MDASNNNTASRIAAGTVIKGEITSPTDIRIDGDFEGKLISKGKVLVGDTAKIVGDIICQNIELSGKVKGDLYVKDTLSLKSGCVVDGNLNASKLYVELGSVFNGNCKMITDAEFDRIAGLRPAAPQVQPSQQPVHKA